MKKIFPLLLMLFLIASCEKPSQTVRVKNYSVELPGFVTQISDLHDEASLQYGNTLREFYVVVIDEPKKEFTDAVTLNAALGYAPDINGYADVCLFNMRESGNFKTIPPYTKGVVNRLPMRIINAHGTVDGNALFWKQACIEGKDTFYQVITWTLESKKEEHEKQMDAIINSFKELRKSR